MSKPTIESHFGMRGRYRLRVSRAGAPCRVDTGWFDNVITDDGLNEIATKDVLNRCVVGSGSSTPSTSDTSLDSFIAKSSSISTDRGVQSSTTPYYAYSRGVYTFDAGEAEGNVSEVGISWNSNTTGGELFSRALILDENEQETTITVLPDEILTVEYELRLYPDFDDQITTVVDSGPAGTSHQVTQRVNSFSSWSFGGRLDVPIFGFTAGTGSLGGSMENNTPDVTSLPTYSPAQAPEPYVNNSHEREYVLEIGIDKIHTQDLEFIAVRFYRSPLSFRYQYEIDPPIVKTDEDKLTLGFKLSWGRR